MEEPTMPPWLNASCPMGMNKLLKAQMWIWRSMPPRIAIQIANVMRDKMQSGTLPMDLARELANQMRDAASGVLRAAVQMFALSSVIFETLGDTDEARKTFGRARAAYEPLLDEAVSGLRKAAFDPTPTDVMGVGAN